MHSYSQMWFYPYAYAPHTYPPNVQQLASYSNCICKLSKLVFAEGDLGAGSGGD